MSSAPPPATPEPEGGLLDPASAARARVAFEAAQAEHGHHGLALSRFRERVAALAQAQARRLGLPVDACALSTFVERAALGDLCLATACEDGAASAWNVLHARWARRLEGFAVKRGLCPPDAEALVQDVFGDLAAPPPRASCRTLLGTFDGSGSLFGWLSVVVLRRIAGQARRKQPRALETLAPTEQEASAPPRRAEVASPAASLENAEAEAGFGAAFARAFDSLPPQQRLALVLKHRDGLSQRDIAVVLKVGEARVSRVVSAALEALVEDLGSANGHRAPPDADTWRSWAHSVSRHLASSLPLCVLPVGRTGACAPTPPGSPSREGA